MNDQNYRMKRAERFENMRQKFRDTFSLFVGPGRLFSVDEVEAGTGIPIDTLRRYIRGETTPELANAMLILSILPPEFANTLLRQAGLIGCRRVDGETTPALALKEITEAAAALAAALADGHIDHLEVVEIRRELTEAQVAIAHLLADLERQP